MTHFFWFFLELHGLIQGSQMVWGTPLVFSEDYDCDRVIHLLSIWNRVAIHKNSNKNKAKQTSKPTIVTTKTFIFFQSVLKQHQKWLCLRDQDETTIIKKLSSEHPS